MMKQSIPYQRMFNQHIIGGKFDKPEQVDFMGLPLATTSIQVVE